MVSPGLPSIGRSSDHQQWTCIRHQICLDDGVFRQQSFHWGTLSILSLTGRWGGSRPCLLQTRKSPNLIDIYLFKIMCEIKRDYIYIYIYSLLYDLVYNLCMLLKHCYSKYRILFGVNSTIFMYKLETGHNKHTI